MLWKKRKSRKTQEGCGLRKNWKVWQKPYNAGFLKSQYKVLSLPEDSKCFEEIYAVILFAFYKGHSGYSIKN